MNKIQSLINQHCPNGVPFKKLGEVCSFEYGKPLKETDRDGGLYPVMGSNGIVGYHNEFLIEGPCVIVGRKGSAGALNWVTNNCYPIDTTFYIKLLTNEINLKFLFYYLSMIGLAKEKQSGGVPGLNRNEAYLKEIPIPPLPVQKEIVSILDKFTELEAKLEAELAARKKQYEYYRCKLLTFNEMGGGVNG
jgi:restriction endonuclease S subunit